MIYSYAEYDATSYFRSEVIAKNTVENTASGVISRQQFKQGSQNFQDYLGQLTPEMFQN